MAYDSSAVIAWATGCEVVRGPVDIVDPDGPKVRYGSASAAIGPASLSTQSAVSLGDGGYAVLTFDSPIRNNPGPDFAVFENSFNDSFLELAFVEVSTDGVRYVRFPAVSLTPVDNQIISTGFVDPTNINNLAGKYRVGYGTPFDLEELRDSLDINIDSILYVRVVDVIGTVNPIYATHDAQGHIVNDPYPTNDTIWASGGFDLTGVAVLRVPSSVGVVELSETVELAIFPNPAHQRVTLLANTPTEATLTDMSGRCLITLHLSQGTNVLDLDGMPGGVYVVRTEGKSYKVVKR